mmetsp:Transcript_19080/g.26849  ORF Transcript_19080/g.26849 Transcript_19080/m.26849 type:complete len:259 (+) Transcript_19080:935-1711(+)
MSLHHIPISSIVRIHGCTFEHEGTASIEKWSINDVGVSSDPTSICHTSINIALTYIKGVGSGMHGIKTVSTGGVQNALGSTRTPRSVKDEQIIFCIHPFTGTIGSLCLHHFIKCHISPRDHGHTISSGSTGMSEDKHFLHNTLTNILVHRGIANFLQRQGSSSPLTPICGDHPFTLRATNTFGNGVRAKSSKDDGMDCTNSCTGQHGHGNLRNHGHVECHNISLTYTLGTERICDLTDLTLEFEEGDAFHVRGFISLP